MDIERIHRLAEEADAEHRASLPRFEQDVLTQLAVAGAEETPARRAFLRRLAAGAGAAVLAVPLLGRAAAAQSTTSVASTTTTTTPPSSPSDRDKIILGFAQSVELAAVKAYEAAEVKIVADLKGIANAFRGHHQQHAQAHASLAGKAALNVPNASLLKAVGGKIEAASTTTELMQILEQLENAAASTYLAALSQLVGTDAARLVASILPTESRHAVVWGGELKEPVSQQSPAFETFDNAITPDQYPVIVA